MLRRGLGRMPLVEPRVMEALLAYLRSNCAQMCRHWFNEIEVVELSQGTLTLLVKEQVRLKYLQRCCVEQFTEAAQSATGRLLAVEFVGEDTRVERAEDVVTTGVFTQPELDEEMILSPDYTFDSFVVGPDNRLAHAASLAVAQKPGKAYNPFFVHGGVGLGKTHLLQAICQMAMRVHGGMRIFYTSCNGFMNHFMEAVQSGQMADFRHRFRNFDLLIVDDIHDLSKRGPSQEEFFHTFNTLYQAGRQIVLSSDAPPNEIPDLEERLTSRFNCGLVANVERPCYETRVAIVRSKALMRNVDLPDDCAAYIASRLDSNIRELEGAITKLQGLSLLEQAPIDLELCKKAIGEQESSTPGSPTTIQEILNTISSYYGLRITDLLSKRRHKSIALPRQIGMYLARKHTRFSLGEIGGYFGGRDHTTVMHAIRSIDSRRTGDRHLDDEVRRLEELIVHPASPITNS
ncbi:MAG: chromosomal replication initiator protein DnaA [Planctomycetota bacterium]|nr:chromosomal replication initiator protein DnaA [Planctomycetota bacterium]